jgi:hypothetical protein
LLKFRDDNTRSRAGNVVNDVGQIRRQSAPQTGVLDRRRATWQADYGRKSLQMSLSGMEMGLLSFA